jgi:hypothetical protein
MRRDSPIRPCSAWKRRSCTRKRESAKVEIYLSRHGIEAELKR